MSTIKKNTSHVNITQENATNVSTAHTPSRTQIVMRILLTVLAGMTLCVSLALSLNLLLASTYNSATQQLSEDIAEYTTDNPDLNLLAANQAVTDDQFRQAQSLSWLQLPTLRSAVQHNAEVSQALTKQINEDLNNSGENASSQSPSQNSSSESSSDDSNSKDSRSQRNNDDSSPNDSTNERMRTLVDNNTYNHKKYEPQAPKNTTKKPW